VRWLAATAVAVLTFAGCGSSKPAVPAPPSTRTPVTVAAPLGLCPARDRPFRSVLSRRAGEVLVPGPPISPRANCDEVLGDRSELFLFRYPKGGEARALIVTAGCIPVVNGRIVRAAIGSLHGSGETHWVDEELL